MKILQNERVAFLVKPNGLRVPAVHVIAGDYVPKGCRLPLGILPLMPNLMATGPNANVAVGVSGLMHKKVFQCL